MSWMAFPYQVDTAGRTATATEDMHIADLVQLVVLTEPGERVNRPTFGVSVHPLVFGALGGHVVSSTEALISGALTQWLDTYLTTQTVSVSISDATLAIHITYQVRSHRTAVTQVVSKPGLPSR